MVYELGSKKIRIPDNILDSFVKNLGVTKEEAIQIYLEDEGYIDNAEQIALDKKAKDSKITATIHQAKALSIKPKTQKERVQKEDKTKEGLIAALAEFLKSQGYAEVEVANKTKLVTFKIDEEHFKLDLIRQRQKKE